MASSIPPIGPPIAPTMPVGISGTSSLSGPLARSGQSSTSVQATTAAESPIDFGKLLLNKFEEVNTMQTGADAMVHEMLTGGAVNQAEAMTSVQKADLAFRMMLQVRNKLIEAFRELQQIQI